MVSIRMAVTKDLSRSDAPIDGRRLRSQVSRTRIIEALMTIVAGGQLDPAAEEVAAAAGVGLRSVFRHFKDMESLRQEMSDQVEQRLRASLVDPIVGETWRERLDFIVARRSSSYEQIMPYHRAALLHAYHSEVLRQGVERLNSTARAILVSVLPAELVADKARFAALELLMSFEGWVRLRLDQGLTPDEARAAVQAGVDALHPRPAR